MDEHMRSKIKKLLLVFKTKQGGCLKPQKKELKHNSISSHWIDYVHVHFVNKHLALTKDHVSGPQMNR